MSGRNPIALCCRGVGKLLEDTEGCSVDALLAADEIIQEAQAQSGALMDLWVANRWSAR